jgi:D-apionate oxidoisomerase
MEQGQAISSADAIVMAVPDRLIGKILKTFVNELRPGAKIIVLDAAAPHAGELPERGDITYFVKHPCHPPIFNDETDPKAKTDYFGGVHAKRAYSLRADAGAGVALRRMRGDCSPDL